MNSAKAMCLSHTQGCVSRSDVRSRGYKVYKEAGGGEAA